MIKPRLKLLNERFFSVFFYFPNLYCLKLRALRRLQHENLVNMLEFTRKRRRLYIIFEFVDGNVLDYLESTPNRQICPVIAQEIIWQLLRALEFMHQVKVSIVVNMYNYRKLVKVVQALAAQKFLRYLNLNCSL